MNEAIRKQWTKALRSERYDQGSGFLRQKDTDGDAYCCLGVLCDLLEPSMWSIRNGAMVYEHHAGQSMFPSDAIMDAADLDTTAADDLAHMNDSGDSFDQIADWIEKWA